MTEAVSASFQNITHESVPLGFGPEGCARVTIHRTYSGALVGESQAELLVCPTAEGVFGYVGFDHFKGRLDGRAGSFVYQHGEMHDRGARRAFGFVVTGSGSGELAGLRGDLLISVSADGAHDLKLEYALDG
jgi:uncharacterized protein DUF3224